MSAKTYEFINRQYNYSILSTMLSLIGIEDLPNKQLFATLFQYPDNSGDSTSTQDISFSEASKRAAKARIGEKRLPEGAIKEFEKVGIGQEYFTGESLFGLPDDFIEEWDDAVTETLNIKDKIKIISSKRDKRNELCMKYADEIRYYDSNSKQYEILADALLLLKHNLIGKPISLTDYMKLDQLTYMGLSHNYNNKSIREFFTVYSENGITADEIGLGDDLDKFEGNTAIANAVTKNIGGDIDFNDPIILQNYSIIYALYYTYSDINHKADSNFSLTESIYSFNSIVNDINIFSLKT